MQGLHLQRPGLRQRERLLGGKIFQDMGAKMIAVGDHTGFIRNDKGIDATTSSITS
jgi:hypothetical protein